MPTISIFLISFENINSYKVDGMLDTDELHDKIKKTNDYLFRILHVGVDFENPLKFRDLVSKFSGNMLATISAKLTLPEEFIFFKESFTHQSGTQFFVVDKIFYPDDTTFVLKTLSNQTKNDSNYVNVATDEDNAREIVDRPQEYSETSDTPPATSDSTNTQEDCLSYFTGIFSLLDNAPPWLLRQKTTDIPLCVRAANIFNKNDINTVRDLKSISLDTLLSFKGFGWRSAKSVLDGLRFSFERGPLALDIQAANEESEAYIPISDSPLLSCQERIDIARQNIVRQSNQSGIDYYYNIATYAPDWVLEREIKSLPLTFRAKKIFANLEISTIRDLQDWPKDKLLSLSNFGNTTIENTNRAVQIALLEGPLQGEAAHANLGNKPLIKQILETLDKLPERERSLMRKRMGFEGTSYTLQKIGESFGYTKERVRQLEFKCINTMRDVEFWDDVLLEKISALLTNRTSPLFLDELHSIDSWFDGIEDHWKQLDYIFSTICEEKLHLIETEGRHIIARISQKELVQILSEGHSILTNSAKTYSTEIHCKSLIASTIPDKCQELYDYFWQALTKDMLFAKRGNDERVIVSVKRNLNGMVRVILVESDRPLHYKTIARLINKTYGTEFTDQNVMSSALTISLLYGRGTFGLSKHFPLTSEERTMLIDELSYLLPPEDTARQWHCAELHELQQELALPFAEKLTPYIVNIALTFSEKFQNLGKLIWKLRDNDRENVVARVAVCQEVERILLQAGSPLHIREIEKILHVSRSVVKNFQISTSGNLIKTKPGYYGIYPRDMPFSESIIEVFTNKLTALLELEQKGIHTTELSAKLANGSQITFSKQDLYILTNYCLKTDAFSIDSGRYIYLQNWSGSRRLNLIDTIRKVFRECAPEGIHDHLLSSIVTETIGHKVHRNHIASTLLALGATWNSTDRRWKFSSSLE